MVRALRRTPAIRPAWRWLRRWRHVASYILRAAFFGAMAMGPTAPRPPPPEPARIEARAEPRGDSEMDRA